MKNTPINSPSHHTARFQGEAPMKSVFTMNRDGDILEVFEIESRDPLVPAQFVTRVNGKEFGQSKALSVRVSLAKTLKWLDREQDLGRRAGTI